MSKIVSQTPRSCLIKGRDVTSNEKSTTRMPRLRCAGSPRKQPREKGGVLLLSNLKNSNDRPSQRIHRMGNVKPPRTLLRSQAIRSRRQRQKCKQKVYLAYRRTLR